MGWLGVLMGKNFPKLSDALTDTARADDRTLNGLSGFVEVRPGSVYPAEAGLTVGEKARNRLIDIVGNLCGYHGHDGDPRLSGTGHLRAMQIHFRTLRRRTAHDYTRRSHSLIVSLQRIPPTTHHFYHAN